MHYRLNADKNKFFRRYIKDLDAKLLLILMGTAWSEMIYAVICEMILQPQLPLPIHIVICCWGEISV